MPHLRAPVVDQFGGHHHQGGLGQKDAVRRWYQLCGGKMGQGSTTET